MPFADDDEFLASGQCDLELAVLVCESLGKVSNSAEPSEMLA